MRRTILLVLAALGLAASAAFTQGAYPKTSSASPRQGRAVS